MHLHKPPGNRFGGERIFNMKYGMFVAFMLLSARMVLGLEIESFSAQGLITFVCTHDQGVVTAETLCDLHSDEGWVKVGEVTLAGPGGSVTVPVCTNKAYYRLLYYPPAVVRSVDMAKTAPLPQPTAGKVKTPAASPSAAPSGMGDGAAGDPRNEPVESVVAMKEPGGDDFVLLEKARQNIIRHWRIIYPTPLVFTNVPGSQADLQDLSDALNKLSGKFYRLR